MGEPIGRATWRELIDRFIEERHRYAVPDGGPFAHPNPGADEGQLRAAEERIGRTLDPQHREFLSVADGWDRYLGSSSLLGTDDLGAGPRWRTVQRAAAFWLRRVGLDAAGLADEPAAFWMIGDHGPLEDGRSVYMYVGDGSALAAGTTFGVPSTTVVHPDLYSFLRAELTGVHALVPGASLWHRGIEEIVAVLAEVPYDLLVDTVADDRQPWWRRGACAKALTGRSTASGAARLLDVVRDGRTGDEVCGAVLELLTAVDGPHTDALLAWLRSRPPPKSGTLKAAIPRARAQLGDLTATDQIVELSACERDRDREVGEQAIDLLIAPYGIRSVFGVGSAGELMVHAATAERRLLGVRLQQRSGGDLTAALADSATMVARAAYERLADDPDAADTLQTMVGECAPGHLWALAALAAQGHPIGEHWIRLGRPRIELPGVPSDVRAAILRRWAPGQRDTDPRWLLEAACTPPPEWPCGDALVERAMSALTAAGLDPGPPQSAGEEYRQGAGTYYNIDTTSGRVVVSTLGPFFSAADQDAIDAMNGFRHIDRRLANTVFTGLSVYYFGDRKALPVGHLLFYWQD
jgi:hypothetical protein